eukprot:CAMPEP_0202708646 /NCGR_PEP_ID=MMETSP1385-20130828/20812_1 /ASSEMBLY_ACC=CAM_ASM_000861 /TAXON_ID=933848 /ORGANISM="Elphidium margaritaceum" /LENGTH=246 /DNA_ID=CAMNT_0049367679 /DNA_START=79 /DNA_END=819 /DNA_ORIENTATION=+
MTDVSKKETPKPQVVSQEGGEGVEDDNQTLQLAIEQSKIKLVSQPPSLNAIAIEAHFSMEHLVNELEQTLAAGHYKQPPIFNKVQMLMEHYDSSTLDYQKYALRSGGNMYTRNLVKKTPYFTLMVLVWPPSITSPIHDHGGSECWLRVVSGSLEERFYETPECVDSKLRMRFAQVHASPAVCFINDEQGLHAIANPSDSEWAISLHCYVPGYEECHAFFDKNNAQKGKKCCKLAFNSVDGVMLEDE